MNFVFERLKLVHILLDAEVRRELAMRFRDHSRVRRLKKLKLAIKDQLARFVPCAVPAA